MIRPEEVLDHRFLVWETTIDGILRSHEWSQSRTCPVQIGTQQPGLDKLLDEYRRIGWIVHAVQNDRGTLCRFMPAELLETDDFDEQA